MLIEVRLFILGIRLNSVEVPLGKEYFDSQGQQICSIIFKSERPAWSLFLAAFQPH